MTPNKNLLKVVFIVPVVALAILTAHFVLKSNKLSGELKNQQNTGDNFNKENIALKKNYAKIQDDYEKIQNELSRLKKDYETLVVDRDNLFGRVKSLSQESDRADQLAASLEKLKADMQVLEKGKQKVQAQNLDLKKQIKDFITIQKQLLREKEQLTGALEKFKDTSAVGRLEKEKASLKEENAKLANSLKETGLEIGKFKENESKLRQEIKQLTEQTDKLNKDYAEAVKKNKAFEKQVIDMPVKFAEVARQNTALVRETANMHYNLGVFYMKQKDYSRAVSEFEKSIELTPDDTYAHFNLGYIYAEYLVSRPKAVEHFRQYLRLAKKDDKDVDWVKKYILTWEAWSGKQPLE
jgi:tetratricopeptide (TPR) repeat protein